MEENKREEEYGSDIKIKSPLLTKLENFWYYYKWHSLIALFIILVVTVCTVQMCSKSSIDIYIMYAGDKEITRTSSDGNIPPYNQAVSSLESVAEDYDGDGRVVVSFSTLFCPTDEQIEEIEGSGDKEISSLAATDRKTLADRMYVGEYYICFFSPHVYEEYKQRDGISLFMPIANYAPENNELEYYNEYAVKLSSTSLYDDPAIKNAMPEDTLIVMRIKSAAASLFGGAENDERFRRSEEFLKSVLAG